MQKALGPERHKIRSVLTAFSEQNYRTLIELCPDALIVHDGEAIVPAKGNEHLELSVEDEGTGSLQGFDVAKHGQGLGMRMIASLTQARGGRSELETAAAALRRRLPSRNDKAGPEGPANSVRHKRAAYQLVSTAPLN